MGKALYRKYRSKKLSDVVGQEHVTQTLAQAIKDDRLSHAYLFTGPRGVGKTSVARILAHEVNILPYTDDTSHIDIIEIDAASNRRIDEIRELREKVYTAPIAATYKVYIIDEVHMLTREAFNALLKTLEEPPAHVIFILATTDLYKLPATIISRTQRFNFKAIPDDKVIKHLEGIAEAEAIKIDTESLALLAEHGEGSLRDSISLLDQASGHSKDLKAEDVRNLLGIPPKESIEQLFKAAKGADSAALVRTLEGLYGQGFSATLLAKELSASVRQSLLNPADQEYRQVDFLLLEKLLEVSASSDPARFLEIALLQFTSAHGAGYTPINKTAQPDKENMAKPEETPGPIKDEARASAAKAPTSAVSKPKTNATKPRSSTAADLSVWPDVLAALKSRHNTLYGVVRMAEPTLETDNTLKLKFAFAFHQKRINEAANRQVLIGIIKELTGKTVAIECVHSKDAVPPKLNAASPKKSSDLHTISNIFGGGELLES
jgi:DNA polymerase-3 subunit gamma/tau